MNVIWQAGLPPFGLFELDSAGTVLYSRPDPAGETNANWPDVVGRNFYIEVAAFGNIEELRRKIAQFTYSSSPADSFHFECECEDGPLAVRILLARIRERSSNDRTKSVLVHIRKGV
jgi:hypothetical protein